MPVFLPENPTDRELIDHSPWALKNLDTALSDEHRDRIRSIIEPTSEDRCEEHMRLLLISGNLNVLHLAAHP